MSSRSLPLFARAGRPPPPGILSTKPSWLLPGAFGLAPPLHDDTRRISVPRPALRLHPKNQQLPYSSPHAPETPARRLDLGADRLPGHKGAHQRRIDGMDRNRPLKHPAHPRRHDRPAIGAVAAGRLGNDASRALLLGAPVTKNISGRGRVSRPTASALDRCRRRGARIISVRRLPRRYRRAAP
jgi:hypothetical protein